MFTCQSCRFFVHSSQCRRLRRCINICLLLLPRSPCFRVSKGYETYAQCNRQERRTHSATGRRDVRTVQQDERSMNRTLFSNRCAAEFDYRETTVFTCIRTSASQVWSKRAPRHTFLVSIMQALSFRSLGVPSLFSSHTSRSFRLRGPCAGVQIPGAERQWS